MTTGRECRTVQASSPAEPCTRKPKRSPKRTGIILEAIASEDPSLGPDRGEFVISRGEGNVTGDLQVAIRVPATVPAPLSIASLGADYTLSVGGAPISLSASGEGTVTIPDGKSSAETEKGQA